MPLSPLLRRLHKPVYECRLHALSTEIAKHLQPNETLLDVGCGVGTLAYTLMGKVEGLKAIGLERALRGSEPIPVTAYAGGQFPMEDDSVDVVTIADVLHHDTDSVSVLKECARVAKRLVIVKDHKPDGLLGQARVSLMDWAANAGYGVPCLYDYPSQEGWQARFNEAGLALATESTELSLYPAPYRWFFTPRLQYLATLTPLH